MNNPFAQQGQQQAPAGNPFGGGQQQAPAAPPQQQAPQGNPFGGAPAAPPAQTQQAPQQAAQPASGGGFEFGQPATGGGDVITGDTWRAYVGHLVLFEPVEFRENIPTANGAANAVVATVTVIDHAEGPRVHDNTLVFPPALVTATRAAVANRGMVLGRLALYDTKAGRQTVELREHSPQDAATASQYLQWRQQQGMQQPTQDTPPY